MGRHRSALVRRLAAMLTAAMALAACQKRVSQIVIRVDTNMTQGPRGALTGLRLRVLSAGETAPRFDRTVDLGAADGGITLPSDLLGVSPRDGDPTRTVRVEVDALQGTRTLFTTSAVTRFMPERTLLLELFLADRCRAQLLACSPGLTCGRTGCEPEVVLTLPPYGTVPDAALADADAAGPGDASRPLDGSTPPSDVPDVVVPPPDVVTFADVPRPPDVVVAARAALYVTQNPAAPSLSDGVLIARLLALGYLVRVADDSTVAPSDATGTQLVVISEATASSELGGRLRDVPVPTLVLEPYVMDEMGMAGGTLGVDVGTTTSTRDVAIVTPSHAAAGGLRGTVRVYDNTSDVIALGWARPGPTAVLIAAVGDRPDRYSVFGYSRGDAMVGFTAPARRTGFFVHGATAAEHLSSAGFALFDAAVRWTGGP